MYHTSLIFMFLYGIYLFPILLIYHIKLTVIEFKNVQGRLSLFSAKDQPFRKYTLRHISRS